MWRETQVVILWLINDVISIHSLRVEGDNLYQSTGQRGNISIHSLRVEGDNSCLHFGAFLDDFNPLPPCGGRPALAQSEHVRFIISIHSLRVEGDNQGGQSTQRGTISIHSLRVEGDYACTRTVHSFLHFNPLPPCGGRPKALTRAWKGCAEFQSTPSVWRETVRRLILATKDVFQSTPSVWRETAAPPHRQRRLSDFNPLPPCGGRPHRAQMQHQSIYFNPLPPCGGRLCIQDSLFHLQNFNPLPPCGGRLLPA